MEKHIITSSEPKYPRVFVFLNGLLLYEIDARPETRRVGDSSQPIPNVPRYTYVGDGKYIDEAAE